MKLIITILALFSVIARSAVIVNNKLVSDTMSVNIGKSLEFSDSEDQTLATLHFVSLFEQFGSSFKFDNTKSIPIKEVTPDYVSTSVFRRQGYFTFESNHMLFSRDVDYTNEKNQTMFYRKGDFRSSIHMTSWDFSSRSDSLSLQFDLQGPVSDIRKNVVHFDNFRIEFDTYCIVDGHMMEVALKKGGKYYYLEFPVFTDDLFYEFSVIPNEPEENLVSRALKGLFMAIVSTFAVCMVFYL